MEERRPGNKNRLHVLKVYKQKAIKKRMIIRKERRDQRRKRRRRKLYSYIGNRNISFCLQKYVIKQRKVIDIHFKKLIAGTIEVKM